MDDEIDTGYRFNGTENFVGNYDPIQPEETEAIRELRDRVKDIITPAFEARFGGPSRAYERFLIARNQNVKKAEKMLRATVDLRKDWRIGAERTGDELKEREELFERIRPFWKVYYWGFTKQHRLVIYSRLKDIRPNEFIRSFPEDQIKEFYFDFMEGILTRQNYANTPPRRSPAVKEWLSNLEVYDFKGISRHQLQIRGLLVLKRILALSQDHYPECLHKTYLINVPWYFAAAWKVVSVVLSKDSIAKITISSGNSVDAIAETLGSRELAEEMLATE